MAAAAHGASPRAGGAGAALPERAGRAAAPTIHRPGSTYAVFFVDNRAVKTRPPLYRILFAPLVRVIVSPYYRYRHAQRLHAMRVGLAMLVSILVTTGINVPHGIWASVTVLIVIGGLQHHGNIRKKAADRALGTILGMLIGLALLVQLRFIGSMPLTYVLMSIVAGVCAYYAIGSAGYVALLTAITMCVVAGHGDNTIDTGLWRALNVMVGIVIALAFSFALPLHATYSWRYRLARNLRECARLYARVAAGAPLDAEAQLAAFAQLNTRLVQLRSLMPSVAKEIDLPVKRLEAIQRLHRAMLSALEMMAAAEHELETTAVIGPGGYAGARAVRAKLLAMARALRFGSGERLRLPPAMLDVAGANANAPTQSEPLAGPLWLGERFAEQVERLRVLLAETEPNWNIEGKSAASASVRVPGSRR